LANSRSAKLRGITSREDAVPLGDRGANLMEQGRVKMGLVFVFVGNDDDEEITSLARTPCCLTPYIV